VNLLCGVDAVDVEGVGDRSWSRWAMVGRLGWGTRVEGEIQGGFYTRTHTGHVVLLALLATRLCRCLLWKQLSGGV